MKTSFYLLLILLSFISCKEKNENEMKYKRNTKDFLFYNNIGIKNKSAQKVFREGLEYVENEKFDLANEKFVEADKIESKNPTILNAIAQAELRLGNTEKSNKISLNILAIDSTYIETYVNLGGNYMSIKDYEKARDILKKGLKFTTNKNLQTKSLLFINLAVAYNNLGDYENGFKYSNEALEISKNYEIIEFAEKINLESEEKMNKKNAY
jgi:tetratricopeptide (TPR) repeat protein